MLTRSELTPLIDLDYCVYAVGSTVTEEEPVSYVLHNCKKWITNILDQFGERESEKFYIGGANNFRDKVATIQPYKGNRTAPKPYYYKEIREYFQTIWNASTVDGREADDAIGEEQFTVEPETTCIVSVDKDMLQIPGWHYNPRKQTWKLQSRENGDLMFFWQVIQGDRTDNIPGLYGYGEKKATAIVKAHKSNIQNLKREIVGLYKKQYRDKWASALDEISTLLFIQREPNKTYVDYFGSW